MARGDDDERVRGQARKHVAAQMAVERGQALPGVEQHERAARGDGRRQGPVDLLGERRELARLDRDDRRLARAPRQLVQQRALADAGRPVQQDDVDRRLVVEEALEARQLRRSAHEAARAAWRGHRRFGSLTTVTKKSSICRTTSMNRSKSTGLVT